MARDLRGITDVRLMEKLECSAYDVVKIHKSKF